MDIFEILSLPMPFEEEERRNKSIVGGPIAYSLYDMCRKMEEEVDSWMGTDDFLLCWSSAEIKKSKELIDKFNAKKIDCQEMPQKPVLTRTDAVCEAPSSLEKGTSTVPTQLVKAAENEKMYVSDSEDEEARIIRTSRIGRIHMNRTVSASSSSSLKERERSYVSDSEDEDEEGSANARKRKAPSCLMQKRNSKHIKVRSDDTDEETASDSKKVKFNSNVDVLLFSISDLERSQKKKKIAKK